MKRFCLKFLVPLCFVVGLMVAEPPRLVQQMGNCWLTSLVQLWYNMDSFTNFFCSLDGEKYIATLDPRVQDFARSYAALVRDMKAGVGAETGYATQLADLQERLAKANPTFASYGCDFTSVATSIQTLRFFPPESVGIKFGFMHSVDTLRPPDEDHPAPAADFLQKLFRADSIVTTAEYFFVYIVPGRFPEHYQLQETIDLTAYAAEPFKKGLERAGSRLVYELIGVSMVGGFHSTAYVKDQRDPEHRWYLCDGMGMRVEKVGVKEVLGPWFFWGSGRMPQYLLYRCTTPQKLRDQFWGFYTGDERVVKGTSFDAFARVVPLLRVLYNMRGITDYLSLSTGNPTDFTYASFLSGYIDFIHAVQAGSGEGRYRQCFRKMFSHLLAPYHSQPVRLSYPILHKSVMCPFRDLPQFKRFTTLFEPALALVEGERGLVWDLNADWLSTISGSATLNVFELYSAAVGGKKLLIEQAGDYLVVFFDIPKITKETLYTLQETIDLTAHATPALKKELDQKGEHLEYDLIGLLADEPTGTGGGSYVAYIKDQYGDGKVWQACAGMGPCTPVADPGKLLGQWDFQVGKRHLCLLTYKRTGKGGSHQLQAGAAQEAQQPLLDLINALKMLA